MSKNTVLCIVVNQGWEGEIFEYGYGSHQDLINQPYVSTCFSFDKALAILHMVYDIFVGCW